MARKLNILTFLIFIYSVVVCLTCKRDFAVDISQESIKNQNEVLVNNMNIAHSNILKPQTIVAVANR